MKNVTNKNLQRMKELMGNKKPITENILNSSIELVKKSPNGKTYGIVKENKKYFIKESIDGKTFDFIEGVANKTKNQYNSYEEAVRRLNIMFEGVNTDILTSDVLEEKRFVLKSKKKSSPDMGGSKETDSFDFGGGEGTSGGDDFDFGGDESGDTEGGDDFDFGGDAEDTGGGEFDFGGDTGEDTEGGDESGDTGDLDSDEDLGDDDPIKSIQKMTGKLGQKLRDTEDKSSDIMKWVAKSVLSALDLEQMDTDDKKDLIRTIKKPKDDGSDEEMDFMDDESITDEGDTVVWDALSPEEKQNIVSSNYSNVEEDPNDEETWHPDTSFMEDEEMYGPGDEDITGDEILLDDETDYMSSYSKNVKRSVNTLGKKVENPELGKYLSKLQNKLGGTDKVSVDGNTIVGEFGYIEVSPNGYVLHKEGEKFSKKYRFDQLGDIKNEISSTTDHMDDSAYDEYYEDNVRMMPQPAPSRPSTTPSPTTKPGTGNPGTDKPSPSKRPFTPPPHIRPGEEPAPKAETNEFGSNEGMDYMDDVYDGKCTSCMGTGCEKPKIGFGNHQQTPCKSCDGTGNEIGRQIMPNSENEISEPYTNNPFDYTSNSTLPNRVSGVKYGYRSRYDESKKAIKEAFNDVVDMAKQNGLLVRRKKTTNESLYLNLIRGKKIVSEVRIDNNGNVNIIDEPVDSYSEFDEISNMNTPRNPAPAPAPTKPQTRPEPTTKPGKPGTDKPSPSKRPFTPPPHIRPGEEPAPKARNGNRY